MATTSTDRRFGVSSSLGMKAPVLAASTGNLTLSGLQTVDGISLAEGDRVLAKDQSDATANGIYAASTSGWQREPDFDGANDVAQGTLVYVATGTINGGMAFKVTTAGDIVIGTSSIVFAPFLLPQPMVRSYLAGLTLSTAAGSGSTQVTVSAGECADDTNTVMLQVPLALTADLTVTGAGGLASGATLNANTWYHLFVIGKADGTVSTLLNPGLSPFLPTGYVYKRRIGSVATNGGSKVISFYQKGDWFIWTSGSTLDANVTTQSTTATNYALFLPTGVNVVARILAGTVSGANSRTRVYSPLMSDEAASNSNSNVTGAAAPANSQLDVMTDTSARVRAVSDTALTTFTIRTIGWLDSRGREV
jgi:hypothetical protein